MQLLSILSSFGDGLGKELPDKRRVGARSSQQPTVSHSLTSLLSFPKLVLNGKETTVDN